MPQATELPAPPTTTHPPFRPDTHYQPLINAIPTWLTQATPDKRAALSQARPQLPASLKQATNAQHSQWRHLNARHWSAQNRVDQLLAKLQNVQAFAEPLLKHEIQRRFGLDLDVGKTLLRLYIPDHIPWIRLKSGAARCWTVSLLEAALHNFEESETQVDAFEGASCYITPPSDTGHFQALPNILQAMPIPAFTALCRELDIGQRYKTYLEENLGISNPVVAATLQTRVRDSLSAALSADLHLASMQNLLSPGLEPLIRGLADGLPHLRLNGQQWFCHDLRLMNAHLTGIVLFAPDLQSTTTVTSVVAYIPNDPQHPIKQYPSSAAFAQELGQRLRNHDYQRFFSRFVDHQDRGHFFTQLNNQLGAITFQPLPSGDSRPTWRESPTERVNLQLASSPITLELWTHLYQRKLDKILNDGRVIAVSTASVDQKARWALWDSFSEIASTLLNIVAFIAMPFVPFLGELMLAYMAYQLLDETFESIIDWTEGLTLEAFEHFMTVLESAVQLGTFAAGGAVVAGEFRAVLPEATVRFIDRFKPVLTPSGKTLYWKPDLSPYEHPGALPIDAQVDTLGLHRHQGKTWLKLESQHYVINDNAPGGRPRIQHPSRPEAYQPVLQHNGAGAWQTELDQPLNWDRATLLRRIGPDMQRFSPAEQDHMLTISGADEHTLRKMHVNGEQLPPLLADTLQRFKLNQDIQNFIDAIASDHPEDFRQADPVTQLQLLNANGYWPDNQGLQLLDANAQVLWQSPAADAPMLQIDITRMNAGDLLKTLLLALDEQQIRTMLGERSGSATASLETRTQTLRRTLAELAQRQRSSLFEDRYRKLQRGARPLAQTLIDSQSQLPKAIAEAILDTATHQELQQLRRSPSSNRLYALSQEAALQVRTSRAYEGLYLTSTRGNPDTEKLVLHSLERLPGWSGQLRVEIRHYRPEGQLIDSIGPLHATDHKVLVLNEHGSYQPFDAQGLELSGSGTLYTSLLQALPDTERTALGIHIGESAKLEQLIRLHALDRDQLYSMLSQQPILKPTYDPTVMRLLGGTDAYHPVHPQTPTLQAHAQRLLPQLNEAQLQTFVERLQNHPTGPRAELSRLFAEHEQLHACLNTWLDDIPLFAPDTQARLTPEEFAIQKHSRRQWRLELLEAWRQQAALASDAEEGIEIRLSRPITGELPPLKIQFDRVNDLTIEGHTSTRGAHEFLQQFSGLRRLALRNFSLGRLPEALSQSPQLNELILSDCAISLTPDNLAALSALRELVILDLYKNPLGLIPNVEQMPNLSFFDVSQTGISEVPPGLVTRPRLHTALLNDNQIHTLPDALFELPEPMPADFDLSGNPVRAIDRERIKDYFNLTRQDYGCLAEEADILRVQALYPTLDKEEASELIYLLPGTLEEGRAAIARKENELSTLLDQLTSWTTDIPQVHPITDAPFTAEQLSTEHAARNEFKDRLEQCWRRESELDDFNHALQPTFELNLSCVITGELPVIHADFPHISHLDMRGNPGLTSGAARFLENFPKLRSLTMHDLSLGALPEAIFRMTELSALELSNCQIVLTEQSVLELAQLAHLDLLNLSDNPLGRAPDVSQMSELTILKLDNTGITELPHGLLQLRNLAMADLSDNAISEVPSDILELPLEFGGKISLRGNLLSEQSAQRLIAYFRQNRVDFGVDAVINGAEMEISTSEDSDMDE